MTKLLCTLLFLFPLSVFAAPEAKLWSYWSAHDANSSQQINHSAWDEFLAKYLIVSGKNNLIRYGKVTSNKADSVSQLNDYIQQLSATNPLTLNRNEQMAYWINLYNAVTVNLIIENYPVQSITKLGGLFDFGPWDKKLLKINNKSLSLNDIEHRILRPIWKDKRIHYAVNCASLGCPNLLKKAYKASMLNSQLNHVAKQFINSSKGVNINGSEVVLSKIYQWYAVDFGSYKELVKHLDKYHREDISAALNNAELVYKYDWDLNKAP